MPASKQKIDAVRTAFKAQRRARPPRPSKVIKPKPDWWDMAIERQRAAMSASEVARQTERRGKLFDGISALPMAIDWLHRHGLDVVHCDIGVWKQPCIVVTGGPACELLKRVHGAYCTRLEHRPFIPLRTWRAELLGCYVDWSEQRA